ncbi:MAG TPA: nuclear transport factor 2 family protein [Ktedonobacteraceae bacterium]|nr:nuclear transport factor 2 family protein [Ktedonobacteraceae bacterium]
MDYESFKTWFETLGRAWENRDPHAAAALFTEDAIYHENPFEEPMHGRTAIYRYWSEETQAQEQIRFHSEILGVTQDTGFAHWWVSFVRISSKNKVELDGICAIRLNDEHLCYSLREWWHAREQGAIGTQAL